MSSGDRSGHRPSEIFLQAQTLQQQGQFATAIPLWNKLIDLARDDAELYYKRANARRGLGEWERALADYGQAVALDPTFSNAFCNRGTVLEQVCRWDEALADYDQAITLNPNDYFAFYNRGLVLGRLERFELALASYEKAIVLKADYVEAHVNLGHTLQRLHRDEAAVSSYDTAIRLSPVYAEAFQGRGTSLFNLGRFEAAVISFDRAVAISPEFKFILGMRRYAKMKICAWDGLSEDLRALEAGLKAQRAVSAPFPVLALSGSAALQRLAAEIWVKEHCAADDALGPIPARVPRKKICIGYFSADFRKHPVALLTAELFELHDRSAFEVIAFSFGPPAQDSMRERLKKAFDRFIDVSDRTDVEVAALSREIGVDIAVDLGGFTEHCRTRIFALRAAPLQISYIGYLGTMGAPYFDYLVADATIIPEESRRDYAERIIYLPSYQVSDSTRPRSGRTFSREELGIPREAFVFCCFNSNYKIMPETFEVWTRILTRTPGSVLFINAENPLAARNLQQEFRRLGLEPRRLVFGERLEMNDYLARFRAMDLFLDTWPYNAGTTANDALWAHLPLMTLQGTTFAGRVAASTLRAIGLPELIASTPAEYEDLAVRLATHPLELARIKRTLQQNHGTTPLFDIRSFTANLESAYRLALERHHGSLPTADIRL